MKCSNQARSLCVRFPLLRALLALAGVAVLAAVTPEQAQSEQAKPEQAQSEQEQSEQAKPEQAKPEQAKPEQAKPEQEQAPAAQAQEQKETMQAARKLHGEYLELQNRIDRIQRETVASHPELKQQEEALMELMMKKMDSDTAGSAKEQLAEIEQIEQKLKSEETPASERDELMADYQKKAMAFRAAQMEALKDPQVQKAQKELMDATLSAMKEQDPQTEQLVEQLQQKQQEMKALMEKAAGNMEGQ